MAPGERRRLARLLPIGRGGVAEVLGEGVMEVAGAGEAGALGKGDAEKVWWGQTTDHHLPPPPWAFPLRGEDPYPPVAVLGDMVRQSRRREACGSSHSSRSVPPRGRRVKGNRSLSSI